MQCSPVLGTKYCAVRGKSLTTGTHYHYRSGNGILVPWYLVYRATDSSSDQYIRTFLDARHAEKKQIRSMVLSSSVSVQHTVVQATRVAQHHPMGSDVSLGSDVPTIAGLPPVLFRVVGAVVVIFRRELLPLKAPKTIHT